MRVLLHPVTDDQITRGSDGVYQWRVIPRDRAFNTSTSDTRSFRLDTTPPGPPPLVFPGAGDFINDSTPLFDWEASTGEEAGNPAVENYLLQVVRSGDDFDPGSLVIGVTRARFSTFFQVPAADALADDVYQWRVVAQDRALNTASSVTRTFTVDTTPPGAPALVSPANAPARESFLKDNTPFFDWSPSAGDPFNYRLLVTSGDINTGPLFMDETIADPTTTFQVAPANFLPDGTYQWRVVASDRALNLSTSDTRTFVVDTVAPAPPVLALPQDNALLNVKTPFFDWNESPTTADVFDFRLLVVSGSIATGAVVIDRLELHQKTNFLPTADLDDGRYQWRVIARDLALNPGTSDTRTFRIDTKAPGIPNPLLPPNNTFTNINTPLFAWETASGDVFNYELRVTSGDIINGPFDIQKFVPAPTTSDQTVTPLNDGKYFWRVIARDGAGNEQLYGIFIFTVDTRAPSPTPALITPASGAVTNDNTLFFEWTPSTGDLETGVFDYLLQVTSADTFNPHLDIEAVVPHPGTGHQAVSPLGDATYIWRVIARDLAVNTASSQTRNFTVDATPPAPPTLALPGSGDLINDNSPFFEWTPSSGDVAVYVLLVTSADSFNPHLDIEVVIPHPGTGHQAVSPLDDATYRWRVIASDAVGNTASSVTRTFTVDTNPPGTPSLVSPLDNAFLNDDTPLFEWKPVTGDVFDYLLHVTSGDINEGPFDTEVTIPHPGTGHQPITLLNDGLYSWQVIARDQAGNPQPYGIRTFTIDTVAPDPPTLLAPADNALLTTRTPFFDWEDSTTPADVAEYRLQVAPFGQFTEPFDIDMVITGTPLPTEFQTTPEDALADGFYLWRVFTTDRAGNGSSSSLRRFSISRPPLSARTSIRQGLDIDGVAVLEVRVDGVVDTTGDGFTLLGGIGRYEAEITFDDGCMAILEVREVAPFVAPQHTILGGRLLITADQATGDPQAPLTLTKLVVRLTGESLTPCQLALTSLVIFEASAIEQGPIPQKEMPARSFLRGDASGNGVVNSFDALVILQFVVGMPLRLPAGDGPGKLRPIEAASVFQDGASGDTVSAFDALAIQQLIVGLRDPLFLFK